MGPAQVFEQPNEGIMLSRQLEGFLLAIKSFPQRNILRTYVQERGRVKQALEELLWVIRVKGLSLDHLYLHQTHSCACPEHTPQDGRRRKRPRSRQT